MCKKKCEGQIYVGLLMPRKQNSSNVLFFVLMLIFFTYAPIGLGTRFSGIANKWDL